MMLRIPALFLHIPLNKNGKCNHDGMYTGGYTGLSSFLGRLPSVLKNEKVAHRLILFNGIYAITLLPYPFVLMMSLYMYAYSHSSDQELLEIVTAGLMATYPIGVLVSFICWVFYHYGKYKWAMVIANLFLVWLVAFLIVVLIGDYIV
ncbi:hypothetical protein QVE09_18920 [Paenibacillus sp. ClWae2A]|uniref:hypothetical protein n=1 Tax=Paenibacillus sp. ClWae2A TaxID=3057177 RepID=UPI0028F68F73|nr:hypothetical protein [Paenibacillus sp. ClWae2A]MDT9720977.1 hypothetical protein [Paenibacillus sp. ClWae2A]